MGPKMTLVDLMTCKQKEDEKVTNFISRYPTVYSQVNVKIHDVDLQQMFIANLQDKLQRKLEC